MRSFIQNWNFVRVLRLVFGIIIVWQGIVAHDVLFALAGGFLGFLAIANIGCCGTRSCPVNYRSTQPSKQTTETADILSQNRNS